MMNFIDLKDLKKAKITLKKINVSSEGVNILSKKAVHKCIFIKNMEVKTVNILKQNILSIGGDLACSRKVACLEDCSSDVILMGTLRQLEDLVEKLKKQPFALDVLGRELSVLLKDV